MARARSCAAARPSFSSTVLWPAWTSLCLPLCPSEAAIFVNHAFFQRELVFSKDRTGILVMRIVGDDALNSLQGELVAKLNVELLLKFRVGWFIVRNFKKNQQAIAITARTNTRLGSDGTPDSSPLSRTFCPIGAMHLCSSYSGYPRVGASIPPLAISAYYEGLMTMLGYIPANPITDSITCKIWEP
jgi:hypothetical protein